jgi:membrane protein YqaA with SNARE-associated domain
MHYFYLFLLATWSQSLFRFLRRLGILGLFLLGIADSSFLFLPFGNDVLLITLASRHPANWLSYAIAAAAGSVVGCLLVDLVARKGGEEGLARLLDARRVEKLKGKLAGKTGWSLMTAAILPPPFPFTTVVLAASALQYPRRKLLTAIFVGRMIRFTAEGLLALYFGRRLLRYLRAPVVEYFIYGLIAVIIVGSVISVATWLRSRRKIVGASPQAAVPPRAGASS